jgi:hypothetical protein
MGKKRRAPRGISIDSNIRCLKVYPVSTSTKTITDLQTVGIRMSRDQAIHLARVLMAVTQDWSELELTAYRRSSRRTDGTYKVTVTSRATKDDP